MFWLGLLLAVCYVPGYTGASVPTQWAVLSMVLPLGLWRVSTYGIGHKLFFGFSVYATLSALWSINPYAYVWGMWFVFIWALAFHWGSLVEDLQPMWKGLGVGLSVSTAVAIAQALEFTPVQVADTHLPAGLLFNSSLFGVTIGIVLVALACHRLWWYMPPLALGLLLSGSRGGFLLLALGLIARYAGTVLAAGLLACAGIAFLAVIDLADNQRLMIWGVALRSLTLWGHGAGSFVDIHYINTIKNLLIRPEYVHNDILQLVHEYGLAAALLLAVPALALATARPTEQPILFVWCAATLFYFPLYAPLTAFIGLIMAGHSLRDWSLARSDLHRWRSDFISWCASWRSLLDLTGGEIVPMVPRATNKRD